MQGGVQSTPEFVTTSAPIGCHVLENDMLVVSTADAGIVQGTTLCSARMSVVCSALASFLIVACGGGGGGGSGSSSSPPAPPPTSIKYPASTVAYTAGVSAQTLTPKASGGPVASWSISPALPAGLSFSASTGAISGTPTAASATTSYTVTAQNSGGQVTFSLSIAVEANALVQLGHGSQFLLVRFNGSIVLAEDQGPSYQTGSNPGTPHWVLWNYATGAMVASGSTNCLSTDCWGGQFGDLEGPTVVLKLLDGFEVHTASSGQLLTTISVEQTSVSWRKLATDGSYIVAGGSKGLEAWSPSGQLLVSRIGDYFWRRASLLREPFASARARLETMWWSRSRYRAAPTPRQRPSMELSTPVC